MEMLKQTVILKFIETHNRTLEEDSRLYFEMLKEIDMKFEILWTTGVQEISKDEAKKRFEKVTLKITSEKSIAVAPYGVWNISRIDKTRDVNLLDKKVTFDLILLELEKSDKYVFTK